MNDRYLFRAKRTNNGEWVEGYYVRGLDMYENEVHIIFDPTTMFYSHGETDGFVDVDQSTICQCTGLKDKNGKLIWENDIVYMRCNGLSGYGNVIYENGCFWIDDKKRGHKYPFSNHDVKYRVDGNIFYNPELMHE